MSIFFNNSRINDWNFGDDNIIKVYRNNAVCYYKVTSGDTPTPVQEPCFAVVDDITQYSDTEFVDVFNKADSKWYKLNNLNQFEEYGLYGDGRNITYYQGKLTIDGDYEYQYSGNSWANVGEVSGSSYPVYYDVIQDPPDNVSFSSMAEAEEYECPWVGMNADIDNTDYIFDASYQWVTKYGLFEVSGEYICDNGDKYKKMEEKVRNVDDTWSSQNPPVYEKGELIESASTDCSTYTELTYIQLSDSSSRGGVQLLNTPKEGLLIEIDFEMSGSTATGDIEIIGQKDVQETVSYQMGFMQYNSWTRAYYDYGGRRLNFSSCPSFTTRRTWRIGRISGSTNPNIVGYYCDGTVGTKSVSTLQFDANRPYTIGNIFYNGSSVPQIGSWNIKPMKLYSVKIYEDYGVTLVGDYIPVLKEDGTTLTLYDKVSGNYANPFGTIIAGPSV